MSSDQKKIRIDGVLWFMYSDVNGGRLPVPLCPIHNLRLSLMPYIGSNFLKCEDCQEPYKIPRTLEREKVHVINKIDARVFKGMKTINFDDEYVPLAEKKIPLDNDKYFITTLVTKSKIGLRVVIYAGEKGRKEKTQVFVEPEIKRLSFDQNDIHPTDIFTKIEATFPDGSSGSLKKE